MAELLDAGLPAPAYGAFRTRAGGTSAAPYDGGNLSLRVGDDADRVAANRRQLGTHLGAPRLVFAQQVHGAGVAVVSHASVTPPDGVPDVDALVTTEPGVALVALGADCLPVLLVDPVAGVVAAAHAGRPGLAAGVLQEALSAMAGLGARLPQVHASIGPGVCGLCYEVPEGMAEQVGQAVPGSRSRTRQGTASVDLRAGAQAVLERAGVGSVVHVGACTLEQPEQWFSYRRDGVTGRHGGVVVLR